MFTGRRFDFETGLYYYRARYYNPYIGRFLQTDPVGYGYGYCMNNPLFWIDPYGLAPTFNPTTGLWARPEGFPPIFPSGSGPYFDQTDWATCPAISILDVWLTTDNSSPLKSATTDSDAVSLVVKMLNGVMPGKDLPPESFGGARMGPVYAVLKAKGPGDQWALINGSPTSKSKTPTAKDIISAVDSSGMPVVTGIYINGPGNLIWHDVVIAPTPDTYRTYLKDKYGIDYPYCVLDGLYGGGSLIYLTNEELQAYINFYTLTNYWIRSNNVK